MEVLTRHREFGYHFKGQTFTQTGLQYSTVEETLGKQLSESIVTLTDIGNLFKIVVSRKIVVLFHIRQTRVHISSKRLFVLRYGICGSCFYTTTMYNGILYIGLFLIHVSLEDVIFRQLLRP